MSEFTSREAVLEVARKLISKGREITYGSPKDNFGTLAELRRAAWTEGTRIAHGSPEGAVLDLMLVKLARILTGKHHPDNYIDLIGYTAIMYELIEEARHRDQ